MELAMLAGERLNSWMADFKLYPPSSVQYSNTPMPPLTNNIDGLSNENYLQIKLLSILLWWDHHREWENVEKVNGTGKRKLYKLFKRSICKYIAHRKRRSSNPFEFCRFDKSPNENKLFAWMPKESFASLNALSYLISILNNWWIKFK